MSQIKQVDAVILFSKQVLGERYQDGVDIRTYATHDDQVAISHLITAGMLEGTIFLKDGAKAKYGDKLRTGYVMGMIKNHWTKCKKLNPGYVKPAPKVVVDATTTTDTAVA